MGKKRRTKKKNKTAGRKEIYEKYIGSKEWANLKATMPGVRECVACKATMTLHLHHMFYPDDVFCTRHEHCCWLCEVCHKIFHDVIGGACLRIPHATMDTLKRKTIRIISRARGRMQAAVERDELAERIARDERHAGKVVVVPPRRDL